jgi:cobalt transporter subunit CbtB
MNPPSGVTARRTLMTTFKTSFARADGLTSGLLPILAVAAIGLALIFVAGHAQSATLHGAAHDQRHATGFPCH